MGLKVYNTLTNRIEDFKEMKKGHIGLYTCGPTVYDYAHIGNFRSYVAEDLIKRYFLYRGYRVLHVMNITDIDDKTIRKSNEEGVSLEEVTEKYIKAFFEDIDTLNILKADVYPRATEHINEMIDLINKLFENGYAYKKGNSVYYSIEKFKDYGKLANISKDSLKVGLAVDADEYDKDNVQDFVLWKGKKEGEPSWNCEYGEGRPGWHIECSAMSMKYLGNHFDIHMGGVDNIFPHHDNEIAQSEGATGKKFVNYWLHIQHLIVDGKKMSKSLGNFFTLRDLLNKGYDSRSIRYLLISTHYRKLLNFTFEGLKGASQSLKRIDDFIFNLKTLNFKDGKSEEVDSLIEKYEKLFVEYMDDDFNISGALGSFFEFIKEINLRLKELKSNDVKNIMEFLKRINNVLGVIDFKEQEEMLEQEILEKIELRQKAREEKKYKVADKIRDELKRRGIVLIDTPDGVKWKREK